MILVVTNADDATASNSNVCEIIVNSGHLQLLADQAVRGHILEALNGQHDEPAFLIGHGNESAFIGNDGVVALGADDVQLLSERSVFAIACHTSTALGPEVAAVGGIWCGYVGAINRLPDDEDVIDLFRRVLVFVADNFVDINDDNTASRFIERLDFILYEIEKELDVRGIGSMEPYLSARLLRERLRVWLPGSALPAMSQSATDPATIF